MCDYLVLKKKESISSPDYSILAHIYDSAVALPVFPLLCGAFEHAVKRNKSQFESLADLGCGTGNFLRYIARKGILAIGVDNSQEMLDIAISKKKTLPIQFFRQDLRELKLSKPVDMITCQFNTLNYLLKQEDVKKVFDNCYQSLNPDGYLLFDLITGSGACTMNQKRKIRYGQWMSFWNIQTYPDKNLSRVQITVKKNQKSSVHFSEIHLQRWYPLEVVLTLLKQSGFSLVEIFDLEELKTADNKSYWIQFLARKLLC
ncbi:Methyltransferase domain-containing protein [Nitrosomonas aestuarii]|uniref:Methyltransferase domain-containing protein n=1 Tax=Nitrosomonas aestuarii TaxID=52441 RepID=A0A1I4AL10_9PROT|nr:class I SAM-dependent methyltransferase [Nitrosomonas aestuarii]SFK57054.1 Methyltransferase domain-containing protein [Nitrosomonas aestuarii]